MMQIYYGYGKGKTTSALGVGLRAVGAGMRVSLVQFFKDNKSSELSVLPFDVFESPEYLPFNPDDSYKKWISCAFEYILNCKSDMIILDEFLDLADDFVSVGEMIEIIKAVSCKEIIITGHKKLEEIFDISDYITHMEKIKHPYDNGVLARKGIEF